MQVFWRRPRFWLLVVSNPLRIALTAPARWLLDRASRFGHRAGVALRPPGCGSHGGRNQACQAVQWRWQNRAPSRSLRACSARPCADRAAERTAKSYGSSAAEAADAAAVVGATSGQADRTARRSGPQYGRERRRDNAPVPPIWAVGRPRRSAMSPPVSGCSDRARLAVASARRNSQGGTRDGPSAGSAVPDDGRCVLRQALFVESASAQSTASPAPAGNSLVGRRRAGCDRAGSPRQASRRRSRAPLCRTAFR